MSSGERRVLMRSLVLLLVAGLVRVAADRRRPPAEVLGHLPDRAAELDAAAAALAEEQARRTRPLAEGERLDPNRASAAELDRLPGVGPALAGRIVAEREAGGDFATVAGLTRVSGVGPATLEKLRHHLEIRGRVPGRPLTRAGPGRGAGRPAAAAGVPERVDVNRADSLALLEVPGIGPALAGRILLRRRERGPMARLEELLEIRGIGEKTLARMRERLSVGSR
jgi:competence protein ComEA